ncbi:unnamed protein product, partial [Symbiodinium sp. KB8]
ALFAAVCSDGASFPAQPFWRCGFGNFHLRPGSRGMAGLRFSDLGNVLGLLGLASSLFTTIIGIVYTWYHHPVLQLKWSECGWSDTAATKWVDCNSEWASNFGMAQLPSLVPLLMGIFGTFMYRPMLLQVGGFPKNFVQYAVWLLFQGMFANFGYCGKLGVINGWFSIILAVASLVAEVTGLKTDRMLELTGHKLVSCGGSSASEKVSSRTTEKDGVKDYMPWAIVSAFFCPLLGGYGVYQASQVKKLRKKDPKAARRAAKSTTTWSLYALMLGVVILGA